MCYMDMHGFGHQNEKQQFDTQAANILMKLYICTMFWIKESAKRINVIQ